jgi:hypothetical protein
MHSAHFCSLAIGLFLTISPLLAGLEDFTILVSPDNKQYVILAGDNHGTLPGTQTERLAAAIAECQEKDPTPFEVHIEKPASLFTDYDDTPRITTDLEPLLRGVTGVSVEDCEVRNVSILAFWLFGKKYPALTECVLRTGNKECAVHTATLEDLNFEFAELHNSIMSFAQNLPQPLNEKFENNLQQAKQLLAKFQEKITPYIHNSNTIIETVIQLAAYDQKNDWAYERGRIKNCSLEPFSELFNLNLIRSILTSQNPKKLIVAGILHTNAIKQFLNELHWKIIHTKQSEIADKINFSTISEIQLTAKEFLKT